MLYKIDKKLLRVLQNKVVLAVFETCFYSKT